MNDRADARQVPDGKRTLAVLNQQADRVRAELAALRVDLAQVQREFDATRAAQLLEANERLVVTAMHAQTIADTAKSNLDELARAAKRDPLTDTPGRALLLDRLRHAIALARRNGNRLAVCFLDLDGFKQVNDTHGHATGDAVLQWVARRLEAAVRESDTVSRHSGDEFLVLLADVVQTADAERIAQKMLAAIAAPCVLGGLSLQLSASIGICIYPEDTEDAVALIHLADAAMYRAKRRGPGNFAFHAEPQAGNPAPDPRQAPAPRSDASQALHEPQFRHLREANEQLVMSAVTAQALEDEVQSAHRAQIKFLAMVAHELRNPLNPIRTAAALLDHDRIDVPLLARLKFVIVRQVAHMSRLVEDLLDGSRVSIGKFRLESSIVDLAGIISLAVETCRPAMEARSQRLKTELPGVPLMVNGDGVRLAQVFNNLMDNASKYTPDGGQLSLSAQVQGETIVVTVADNGIGITPDALPHIFDLFVQGTRAVAFHSRGLGIGLAVVRELVESHGGSVHASSAGTDRGSEFVVTLPLADTSTASPIDPPDAA